MTASWETSASWAALRRRAELLAQVRRFFAKHDFLEVETPLLSHDTVVDRHLDPIGVRLFTDPCDVASGPMMWLQTSPEYSMKRLLASGVTAIYQITRAFRGGDETGPLHNPEFTILEWYRVGDAMRAGMQLLDELSQDLLQRGPAEQLSYADAFQRCLGIDPHRCSTAQLFTTAKDHGLHLSSDFSSNFSSHGKDASRDRWLDWLLVSCVEPHLGMDQPTILFDYPASQAALAKVRDGPVPLAERFELYVNGIELANGYHELTDPEILRQRTEQANRDRIQDGKPPLPAGSRLLDAMRHSFPSCAGVALGFDRLALVAFGATCLADVIAFPVDRA